jgi:hypothetical protein
MKTNIITLLINRAHQSLAAADASPRPQNQEAVRAHSPRRLPLAGWRASRWLTSLAALALLLGTSLAHAVTFNDNLTHTINDATYQNDTIVVANNTTLIIEPGAVLGGAVDLSGTVFAYDTSTVTINGGTFGGGGLGSGQVNGAGTSTVTINGGTFGGAGDYSGLVAGADTSRVTINGGTFGGAGPNSGSVAANNSSTVTINGGTFAGAGDSSGQVNGAGTSTVTINGGTFGGTGPNSGSVAANNSSTVTIQGGTFGGTGLRSGLVFLAANGTPTVTFRAASFDTTLYNPTSGGTLGVTFCSQSLQNISVARDAGTVNLETVVCENPVDLINALIGQVNALSIQAAIKNALVVKLNAALQALSIGDTATACARVQDFINLCLAQQGKKLVPASAADALIAEALTIRDVLGCP